MGALPPHVGLSALCTLCKGRPCPRRGGFRHNLLGSEDQGRRFQGQRMQVSTEAQGYFCRIDVHYLKEFRYIVFLKSLLKGN